MTVLEAKKHVKVRRCDIKGRKVYTVSHVVIGATYSQIYARDDRGVLYCFDSSQLRAA